MATEKDGAIGKSAVLVMATEIDLEQRYPPAAKKDGDMKRAVLVMATEIDLDPKYLPVGKKDDLVVKSGVGNGYEKDLEPKYYANQQRGWLHHKKRGNGRD
eukprot:Phypoly_transcript_02651.p3 GENE.Phypoly_transcript_02651~~Phypoly_transcript_02651.p3  ORF type:complete len:101 (-),score=19.30 Phypoly_transcript_02651:1634-1936(-)